MFTTLEIWNGLIADVQATLPDSDVRALPLNKIQDGQFYKSFPDLRSDAVLIVLQGDSDHNKKTTRQWSAVLINRDPAGKAHELTSAKLDLLRRGKNTRLLGTHIMQGRVWVKPGSDATIAFSDPDYSVLQLDFETEEAHEEEVER